MEIPNMTIKKLSWRHLRHDRRYQVTATVRYPKLEIVTPTVARNPMP